MGWTPEQERAINARGKNLLVSAAAGSGKTSVLVERIKKMVLEDGVPLDQFLVVTFTNAAASEMRGKIINALSQAIEGEGFMGNAERKTFLHRQMDLVQQAQISTFHSFAMSVIRRYFHFVGVEPGFKICDEVQGTLMQEEALKELFAEKFESQDPEFLDFVNIYGASRNERAPEKMVLDTHKFIQSLPEPFVWLEEMGTFSPETAEDLFQSPLWREIAAEAAAVLKEAISLLELVGRMLRDAELRNMEAANLIDLEGLRQLGKLFAAKDGDMNAACDMLVNFSFGRFAAGKGETAIYKEVKEEILPYRERAKDLVVKFRKQFFVRDLEALAADLRAVAPRLKCLWGLVREFDTLYKEKKSAKNLLDFSDIEHYALEILAHEEAASEYREKFAYIFIDEYQDSNLVQETLIRRICRPDNVFMVGDVKQSIYKFRLAEPEIFINKYEEYRTGENPLNEKIDLSQNFRSKGGIVAFVNQVFERIMTKESCGLAYDKDAALRHGTKDKYDPIYEYEPELYVVDETISDDMEVDEAILELKNAEAEALAAADILRKYVGMPIWDVKAECARKLRPKDMVVLLRGVKNYGETYYEALAKVGLPAFVDGGEGLFDQLEVETFLNLLRVIDNRHQDVPLISALHSFVFGFTAEDLARIRIHTPKGAYSQAFDIYGHSGPEEPLREKCKEASARLEQWREAARLKPLSEFLWGLILETGYYSYVGGFPQGGRRQANLRALTDRAAGFQSGGGGGLFAFIRYIDVLRKSRVTVPQEKLPGEEEDMVRIMTVHKSKGLEFPVVFLGGLGRGFSRDSGSGEVSFHKDLGAGLRYVDRESGFFRKTLAQTAISFRKEKESLAEEIRILYVALTRPMDKLILLGSFKGGFEKFLEMTEDPGRGYKSFLEMLLPVVREHHYPVHYITKEDLQDPAEAVSVDAGTALRKQVGADAVSASSDLAKEAVRRLSWEYPYSGTSAARSKFTVSQLSESSVEKKVSDIPLREPAFLSGEKKVFTAAEKGTILHRILEHIPFTSESADPGAVSIYIKEMIGKGLLTEEEAAWADIPAICGFFASELGQRACRSDQVFREMPFVARFDREELLRAGAREDLHTEEKVLVQGTIDCFFLEDGKAVILDFKSGYAPPTDEGEAKLLDRYRTQLLLYGEALKKVRKIPVEEIHLYSFYLQKDFQL
ncbi:MAG: helicase-exonuclease AddAB subunit AddA [Clostridiales bacterium]|nr:helicase-exonuclease AddAB subunit AddA [Clostridiales bacterium]